MKTQKIVFYVCVAAGILGTIITKNPSFGVCGVLAGGFAALAIEHF